MVKIDLTHEGYAEAFADCEVGETKTISFKVTEKSDTELVGELETEDAEEPEKKEGDEEASESKDMHGKMPKGIVIAIGKMNQ